MYIRLYLTFLAIVFPTLIHNSESVELDLCASFTREYQDRTIDLVTPNYGLGSYPNNSRCQCDIRTIRPTSQSRSLNVTIEDLNLESCSTSANRFYDILSIRAAYKFQIHYQMFSLCGSELDSVLNLDAGDGNVYGVGNTIFSLANFRITFFTDSDVNLKGAKLKISSHRGISIACSGTSGPLPTAPVTRTTTPTPVTKTKSTNSGGSGLSKEEQKLAERKQQDIIAGSVVGVILTIICVLVVIGLLVYIRKRKQKSSATQPDDEKRMSDRPIYKDPCQGRPALPMSLRVTADPQVNDSYLYMKSGVNAATTPVYADPQNMDLIYENEGTQDDLEYQPGYIIPGNPSNSSLDKIVDDKPLLQLNNKKPIPEPKVKESVKPKALPRIKVEKTESTNSTDSQLPLLRGASVKHDINAKNKPTNMADSNSTSSPEVDNAVNESPLVKPSQLKNKGNLFTDNLPVSKPPVPSDATPRPKPAIKVKPNMKGQQTAHGNLPPPPPPPSKASKPKKSADEQEQDPYQVVNVETVS